MGKSKYQGQKKFTKHKEKDTYDGHVDEAIDEAAKLGITLEQLLVRREAERRKREEEEDAKEGSEDSDKEDKKEAKEEKKEKKPAARKPKPKGTLVSVIILSP